MSSLIEQESFEIAIYWYFNKSHGDILKAITYQKGNYIENI